MQAKFSCTTLTLFSRVYIPLIIIVIVAITITIIIGEFNREKCMACDIHSVATAVKRTLRKYFAPIVPYDIYPKFTDACLHKDIDTIKFLVSTFPMHSQQFFLELLAHLHVHTCLFFFLLFLSFLVLVLVLFFFLYNSINKFFFLLFFALEFVSTLGCQQNEYK